MLRFTVTNFPAFAVPFALASMTALAIGQTVFDSPPTTIPDSFSLNSGDVLNVGDGGLVGTQLRANDGSVVNVEGGLVGLGFRANAGSQVNVTGGNIGAVDNALIGSFSTQLGSTLTVSGGTLGDGAVIGGTGMFTGGTVGRQFQAVQGSTVSLSGAEFKLNGVPLSTDNITLSRLTNADAVLSGTLADGSPFIFSPLGRNGGDELQSVTLKSVAIPAADIAPKVIVTDLTGEVAGMRSGQDFTVQPGGLLPRNFSVVDASLSFEGGEVGRNLEVTNGTVSISSGSIGDYFYAYSGSTVNVDGGSIGFRFEAFDSNVNITDGRINNLFQAHAGTTVSMTGGRVDSIEARSGSSVAIHGGAVGFGGNIYSSIVALSGSQVDVTGGSFARSFRNLSGSDVELIGGEFSLNGSNFAGSSITLGPDDVLTGSLSDGSAFIFTPLHSDSLQNVSLTRAPLAPADTSLRVVDTPQTDGPDGLRPGQSLKLRDGGVLQDNFAVVGANLQVEGGDAGAGVEVVGGAIDIRGGKVGAGLSVLDASLVMSSGSIGERSAAYRGAVVKITGGNIGTKFNAFAGSQITLAGGSVGPDFRTSVGSDVEFVGGDFKLNGAAYVGSEISLIAGGGPVQVFSGVLSDGSPFIFSPQANPLGDELRGINLTRTPLPAADLTPRVLDNPLGPGPNGLRPGQTLTVVDGGELPDNFTAIGATLNVTGGRVGSFAEVLDSKVRISGGEVDGWFQAYSSEIEVTGGKIGIQFAAFPGTTATIDAATVRGIRVYADAYVELSGGSEVEFSVQALTGSKLRITNATIGGSVEAINGDVIVSDGRVAGSFIATAGSNVVVEAGSIDGFVPITNSSRFRIHGGNHAARLNVNSGSILDISGGKFSGSLTHREGAVNISGGDFSDLTNMSVSSNFNLVGLEFYLDGIPLMGLTPYEGIVVAQRNQVLSGVLADGTPFSFALNSVGAPGLDFFSADARITVTLIPEPTAAWLVAAAGCYLLMLGSSRGTRR